MSAGGRSGDPAVVGSRRRSAAVVDLAPLSLVVLAEAAWISALGGLIEGLSARPFTVGVLGFAAFVTAGVTAARLLGRPLGGRWPFVAPALVAIAAVVGTMLSEDARAALGTDPGAALAAHPAGWLAGLAVLRGFAHARLPLEEDAIARLLAVGVPGLAVIAIGGTAIVEPYRAVFQADSMAAVVVFVATATVAVALIRLTAVGQDGGFDWRRNPAWIGLVLVALAIAITATLSLTTIGASVIQVAAGLVVGGLVTVAVAAGLDRSALRVVLALIVFQVILYLVVATLGKGDLLLQAPPEAAGSGGSSSTAAQLLTLGLGGVVLLAIVIAIVVLVAIWMRRTALPLEDAVEETRTIDRGVAEERPLPRRRRSWRHHDPTDASTAYVALIEDLERHPAVRRDPAETPAEHASRLRASGRPALSLDLLAADYALARFGTKELSAREHRRAVGRWRTLRRRLPDARS